MTTDGEREYERWSDYCEAGPDAPTTDEQKQERYRDWRASWTAMVRNKSLDSFWRTRRAGVKGERRSYRDASTANEDTAT